MEFYKSSEGISRIKNIGNHDVILRYNRNHAEIKERMRQLDGVISTGRNFQFEIEKDNSGTMLLGLRRDDGEIEHINSYLPRGVRFGFGEKNTYEISDRKVIFNQDELQFRGSLLGISHEIGHARTAIELKASGREKVRLITGSLANLFRYYSAKWSLEGEDKYFFTNIVESGEGALLPDWYLEKMFAVEALNERAAWASGLLILRDLKRKGYKVLAGYEDMKEVQTSIITYLISHDHNAAFLQQNASTRYSKRSLSSFKF